MTRPPDRKEHEARALLVSVAPAPVPAEVTERALVRGERMMRRRRVVQLALWAFFAAALGFAVWAAVAEPWLGPPSTTTPPAGW
jgi:ferric-dicitrate binding protein FerR (iron transport regulator)